MTARLLVGDVFDRMAELPDDSVDLLITSPPFLALRSYLPADHPLKAKEIGSERTPAEFIDTLLRLTAEWRRLLAPHGSLCVELGDTFSGSGGAGGDYGEGGMRDGQPLFEGSGRKHQRHAGRTDWEADHPINRISGTGAVIPTKGPGWPFAKSLTGIPTLYPWSLAYGRNLLTGEPSPAGQWRIRNLLVWARPNPPVGALGDKFRPATSYITVACTGSRRYFDLDAVREPLKDSPGNRYMRRVTDHDGALGDSGGNKITADYNPGDSAGAPPLDWHSDIDDGPNGDRLWWMTTAPFKGAHYATFPMELPQRLIKAMCPQKVCTVCGKPSERITETEYRSQRNGGVPDGTPIPKDHSWRGGRGGDVKGLSSGKMMATTSVATLGWTDCGHNAWRSGLVLDPFAGSGTTMAAAIGLGRDVIGIDLDESNIDLVRERCGMFLEVA